MPQERGTRGERRPRIVRTNMDGNQHKERVPRVEFDPIIDAVYVHLRVGEYVEKTIDVEGNRVIDFNEKGEVLGVEFLGFRQNSRIGDSFPVPQEDLQKIKSLLGEYRSRSRKKNS